MGWQPMTYSPQCVFVNTVLLEQSRPSIYVVSLATFTLQQQS